MIRVGIGGWTYAAWRGTFYPPGLRATEELAFASRRLTSIEINGTFYRTQSPASFRKWAAETPHDFVFSVKGPRYATNRPRLAEAGPGVARFIESGLAELGPKLGPVLWQLAPNKAFEPEDLAAFLALLPREIGDGPLRHALEVRHASFRDRAFVELAREAGVAIVYADSDVHPAIADITGDFVYARLQRCRSDEPTGYPAADLEAWAERLRTWEGGGTPEDLPRLDPAADRESPRRPCFVYLISGAKVRAPAAAEALIARLGLGPAQPSS